MIKLNTEKEEILILNIFNTRLLILNKTLWGGRFQSKLMT